MVLVEVSVMSRIHISQAAKSSLTRSCGGPRRRGCSQLDTTCAQTTETSGRPMHSYWHWARWVACCLINFHMDGSNRPFLDARNQPSEPAGQPVGAAMQHPCWRQASPTSWKVWGLNQKGDQKMATETIQVDQAIAG